MRIAEHHFNRSGGLGPGCDRMRAVGVLRRTSPRAQPAMPSLPDRTPSSCAAARMGAGEGAWLAAGVLLLAALLAVWMDLSPVHRHHNADSFVPILASLYHWTPFYWAQNRFGMLVPLLALPVEHPFGNLLVQVALRIFAVLLAFFLLARAAVPRAYWPAVGALALVLFLGGKDLAEQSFMYMQPYGQSIALSLGGLLLLERRGGPPWPLRPLHPLAMAVGLVLLALGAWVAPSDLLWLVPFLLLRNAFGLAPEGEEEAPDRPWPGRLIPGLRTLALLAAVMAAFALSVLISWLAPYHLTSFGVAPPSVWLPAWQRLVESAASYLTLPVLAIVGSLVAVLAVFALRNRSALAARRALAAGLVLLGTALAQLAALGITRWLQMNQLSTRYLTPGFLAVATALSAMLLIAALEGRSARWHRVANVLALAALLAVVAFRYGPPSVSRARTALEAGLGRDAHALVAAECTHVIGDYWRVWPAVYHANLMRWDKGESRPVWGISFRAEPTRDLWWQGDWGGARIATFPGDRWARTYRRNFRLPRLYPRERVGTVRVYSAVPARPGPRDPVVLAGARRRAIVARCSKGSPCTNRRTPTG